MKDQSSNQLSLHDKIIYWRKSRRGWAIVIMLDNIRADNFHGFSHIHMGMKGKHEPIKYGDFDTVYNLFIDHIQKNKGINKEELKRGLTK